MTTNFLYTQAPNRKGNISKDPAKLSGGVTAVTRSMGGLSQPKGAQGAPKAGGNIATRGQKVMVQTNCTYDGKIHNDGYMNSDRTNYLK
jgi:hypothetical protein